ncbi:MAG: DNA recombination protein RmuC [Alphaproteobacteria bacterium]
MTTVFISLTVGIILGVIIGYFMYHRGGNDGGVVIDMLKTELSNLRRENVRLIGECAGAREKISTLENVRGEMLREFKNVSSELLDATRKSALEEQQKNMGITITPFREQLEKMKTDFDAQIKDMLKNSTENRASLEEQIKNMMESSGALKKEASDLTTALRGNKKVQGNWGEIQVERLFEILGWEPGVQYEAQKHLSDNHDIPDYIVHMPGDKHFVVDAKMSLNSYMDYLSCEDLIEKNRLWKCFVDATKKHITELGDKNYNRVVDKKFDYVCMFMPLEHAYIELMNRDKEDIYKYAYDRGVVIATPSLLLPMLRTIDTLMRVEKQSKNVEKIVEYAEKLYEKYAGFTEDYKKIGTALDTIQNAYNGGLNKLSDGRGSISGWFDKIKKQGGLSVSKNIALPYKDETGDEDE